MGKTLNGQLMQAAAQKPQVIPFAQKKSKTPPIKEILQTGGRPEDVPEIDQAVIDLPQRKDVAFKIVHDKQITFSKEVARQFIELAEFCGERPLKYPHVEFLLAHAKNGTFMLEQAVIIDCVCKYDGIIRRLNGHHTCWLRHYMDEDWNPRIRHLRYEVETEEDFRKLYSLIDRNAPRSIGHVVAARLFDTAQYKNLTKRTIKATKDGLVFWLWGNDQTERARHRIDEVISLMETEHYQICHEVATFIEKESRDRDIMRRASVSAALFATFSKAKGDADQFWTSVRTGVGIDSVLDPRKTIRDYLQRMKVAGGNAFNRNNMVPSETMYRACIYAWNAWRKNEQLRQINCPSAPNRPPVK